MNKLKQLYRATAVPGLLSIQANVPRIPSFPLVSKFIPVCGARNLNDKTLITLNYQVEKFRSSVNSPGGKCFRKIDNNTLYYEMPIGRLGTLKLKLLWDDLKPTLIVNPTYHFLGRASIGTVPAVGLHLRDIANVALLRNGFALVHAAGFAKGSKTVLLFGLSNTGKTSTLVDLVRNHKANYYGDDMLVTDGRKVYPCPATRININPSLAPSIKYRLHQILIRSIPFMENLLRSSTLSVGDYLGKNQVGSPRDITDVFLLVNDTLVSEDSLTQDEAARLLYASNQTEFTHNTSQIIWAAEYLNVAPLGGSSMSSERIVLDTLSKNASIHYLKGNMNYFKRSLRNYIKDTQHPN